MHSFIKQCALFLILICGAGLAQAEYDINALGKLFTDKQQRKKIDDQRAGKDVNAQKKTTETVKVQGYVKRSEGKSVVWLNNRNTLKSTRVDDIKVHSSSIGKDKTVTVTVDGKSRRLKPGQTWHKSTGNESE